MSESNALIIPRLNPLPAGYFRSKLFSTHYTNNPLIAAASPLLSLLERLGTSPQLPDINTMRFNIEHELYAFHNRLASQSYADEFITIANYLLCATIDELVGKNYLRVNGCVAEFLAFTPSSNHDTGPEQQFFVIVQHLRERSSQYLDLLELAYYCLIAGFEGEYHVKVDGRIALDNLMDELHQLILQNRVYQPHQLLKDDGDHRTSVNHYKPIVLSSLVGILALFLTYISSNSLLERQAKMLTVHRNIA